MPVSQTRPLALRLLTATMVLAVATASANPTPADVQESLAALEGADWSEGYASLVKAVMPAVVAVRVEQPGTNAGGQDPGTSNPAMREFFERFFDHVPPRGSAPPQPPAAPRVGLGSGFLIAPEGLIVTNAHVVGEASRVEVQLDDGRVLEADVRGVDRLTDLALLDVEAETPFPYVNFGDSSGVEVGDKVVAIGNPFGLGGTVTTGIVSALGRRIGSGPYDDFLQIDAPINRGNSGGPTFDLDGNVVGVNTAIFSPSGGSVGIGFAISANLAKDVVADLADDGVVRRGWLGVGIQPLTPELAAALGLGEAVTGTIVTRVDADSPAARAGLATGDVITAVNGTPVDGPAALSRRVAAIDPGAEATFTLLRRGEPVDVVVEVGERAQPGAELGADEPEPDAAFGLALAAMDEAARVARGRAPDAGVLVEGVRDDGPAARAGLMVGDVILEVAQERVATPQALRAELTAIADAGDGSALILYARDGGQRFTTMSVS